MVTEVGLLVFDSTNMALKTEGMLKSARIPCTVVPTPVEITVDCGIALLINEKHLGTAREVLEAEVGCEYKLIYPYHKKR